MWSHILVTLLGVWLMAAPAILGYNNPARNNDYIIGPLVASFAMIAWWQFMRPLRWLNVLLGAWLLLAPWVLGYGTSKAGINSMLAGVLITALSLIRGKVDKPFGGGWSSLWSSDPAHAREVKR